MKRTAESPRRGWTQGPLVQIMLSRLREFYREPEAVFWAYGFPLIMTVALGVAFRNQTDQPIAVDVDNSFPTAARAIEETLAKAPRFQVRLKPLEECRMRLRMGRTDLVVIPSSTSVAGYDYWFDPARPESRLARNSVDDALQRAAGRKDPVATQDREMIEPGGRYIDFLVPGLVAIGQMAGGLWGIGFVTVDMRIRKLLKRLLATPMRKSNFLLGIMLSRLVFMIPEVIVLLVFARFAFGVVVQGSVLAVAFLVILGAFAFAGIGLLVASRAKTVEAVSGLMNLVMLPMWILSGTFFSADRFPDAAQPFIRALPLTQLLTAMRAVMLEGAPLLSQWANVAALAAWGGISFLLALRLFRWQ
ncbi:MAG TPA: ABC transporter permease [Pirellulales bacterium]